MAGRGIIIELRSIIIELRNPLLVAKSDKRRALYCREAQRRAPAARREYSADYR